MQPYIVHNGAKDNVQEALEIRDSLTWVRKTRQNTI